jgi:hypothetical protein
MAQTPDYHYSGQSSPPMPALLSMLAFTLVLGGFVVVAVIRSAPEGYEDGSGFHFANTPKMRRKRVRHS